VFVGDRGSELRNKNSEEIMRIEDAGARWRYCLSCGDLIRKHEGEAYCPHRVWMISVAKSLEESVSCWTPIGCLGVVHEVEA